jgi:NTE family protein
LVFSAGALYAAWEIGVWKAIEAQVRPDLVLGASAGAWVAWGVAGGASAAEMEAEWLDERTAGILRFGPHRSGLLRPEPMHAKARELFERAQPRIPFGMPLVEVPSLRLRLVREREVTWRHLAATCSIPFGYPPVEIDGRRYVDGGFRGALPLWGAERMGATDAIAINCLTAWPFRALRTVMRPPAPGPRLRVTPIEPSEPLGPVRDALVWSRSNIERWIALGERDGNRAMSSVRM